MNTNFSFHFDIAAIYLIAGGLGGLGRSIARCIVAQGARNLVLLSRTGPRTKDAIQLVAELRNMGVHVETPASDVSNASSLEAILEQRTGAMPRIKGCIQAKVVLKVQLNPYSTARLLTTIQDALFNNMSFENWTIGIQHKVSGPWNLHTSSQKVSTSSSSSFQSTVSLAKNARPTTPPATRTRTPSPVTASAMASAQPALTSALWRTKLSYRETPHS